MWVSSRWVKTQRPRQWGSKGRDDSNRAPASPAAGRSRKCDAGVAPGRWLSARVRRPCGGSTDFVAPARYRETGSGVGRGATGADVAGAGRGADGAAGVGAGRGPRGPEVAGVVVLDLKVVAPDAIRVDVKLLRPAAPAARRALVFLLLLLVPPLAVVHDFTDGRAGGGGDFDEIHPGFLGPLEGFGGGDL